MGSLAVLYQRIPLFRLSRALTCGLQTLSSGSVVNSFAAFPLPLRNAWIADLKTLQQLSRVRRTAIFLFWAWRPVLPRTIDLSHWRPHEGTFPWCLWLVWTLLLCEVLWFVASSWVSSLIWVQMFIRHQEEKTSSLWWHSTYHLIQQQLKAATLCLNRP